MFHFCNTSFTRPSRAAELSGVRPGVGAIACLARYLLSDRSLVKPSLSGLTLGVEHFAAILRVGVPGSVNVTSTNMTVALVTGLVAPLGAATLAGYGVAARIEYVLIPLIFGFGTSLVAMVATNAGAGQRERAERIAWIGAGVVTAFTGTIGLIAALLPFLWMGMFTTDADVLAAGTAYLCIVGAAYAPYGFGAALYFGSQGFGRLMWPVLANLVRLAIAAGGGWLITQWVGGRHARALRHHRRRLRDLWRRDLRGHPGGCVAEVSCSQREPADGHPNTQGASRMRARACARVGRTQQRGTADVTPPASAPCRAIDEVTTCFRHGRGCMT